MVRFGDSEHETSPGLKVPLREFGMLEIATRSEAAQSTLLIFLLDRKNCVLKLCHLL